MPDGETDVCISQDALALGSRAERPQGLPQTSPM